MINAMQPGPKSDSENADIRALAISDISTLEKLDAHRHKVGLFDKDALKAVSEHMSAMYDNAHTNPTVYIGTLYEKNPDIGDRLEELHHERESFRIERAQKGPRP